MAHTSASLRYITLDVFTTSRFAGNPLALVLVPHGEDVGSEQMQRIAREFNYSETVFLYEADQTAAKSQAEWHMRIFTIDAELPFAGHPTIGTASYVLSLMASESTSAAAEIRTKLRCKAGLITIALEPDTKQIWADIPHDFHLHDTETISKQQVVDVQPGLDLGMIRTVDVVSPVNGMTFMVAELTDLEALASVAISGRKPALSLDPGWDEGLVATAYYVKSAEDTYYTRMIEKSFEDPATGSMSCGLAILLAMRSKTQVAEISFVQGFHMGRTSEVDVQVVLEDDLQSVKRLKLIGSAVKVMEGMVFI